MQYLLSRLIIEGHGAAVVENGVASADQHVRGPFGHGYVVRSRGHKTVALMTVQCSHQFAFGVKRKFIKAREVNCQALRIKSGAFRGHKQRPFRGISDNAGLTVVGQLQAGIVGQRGSGKKRLAAVGEI